ncbi:MAG: hypothetical protein AB7I79_11960 [Rhizobiaceae bacterium]
MSRAVRRDRSPEFAAGASADFVLGLTSLHHVWGAAVYDTPWRLHIVFISVPAAAAIAALLYASARRGRWSATARWLAIIVIVAFPIAMIGFWEGGWNHLVKNLTFFARGAAAARALFPPPTHEMPSDLIFEVIGVMQFVAALVALRALWSLVRRVG